MGREERKATKDKLDRTKSSIRREYNRLYDLRRKTKKVKLEEPYYLGYHRKFVLKESTSKRKDVNHIRTILKRINTTVWCSRRDFTEKDYKTKKYLPIEQTLYNLYDKEYYKLTARQQRDFVRTKINVGLFKPKFKWLWQYRYPEYFEFKIVKFKVTHRFELDPILQSQLKLLDNKVEYMGGTNFIYGGNSKYNKYYRETHPKDVIATIQHKEQLKET